MLPEVKFYLAILAKYILNIYSKCLFFFQINYDIKKDLTNLNNTVMISSIAYV